MVIILTFNEKVHIERAIQNVLGWADKIMVLDSYSEDNTVAIAQSLGAEVIFRKFDHYKNQREYAIEYAKQKTEWVFFLDADEYLTDNLKTEIKIALEKKEVNGFYIPRRFIFMDKWIKWGGYYPIYLLRLFRPQVASVEGLVNEHVNVAGHSQYLKHDFVDHNLKNISQWIEKHNKYTTQEARALWHYKSNKTIGTQSLSFKNQTGKKQWLRHKIWNRLPMIMRPFLYFFYRYIFRLGFLDGRVGFVYHFLQGYWLWLLVDVKYIEMKKNKCAE